MFSFATSQYVNSKGHTLRTTWYLVDSCLISIILPSSSRSYLCVKLSIIFQCTAHKMSLLSKYFRVLLSCNNCILFLVVAQNMPTHLFTFILNSVGNKIVYPCFKSECKTDQVFIFCILVKY